MKYVTKVKKQVESTPIYAPIYKIDALEDAYDEDKFNAIDNVVNGVKTDNAIKTLFDAINDVKAEYNDIEGMTLACVVKIANDVYVLSNIKLRLVISIASLFFYIVVLASLTTISRRFI